MALGAAGVVFAAPTANVIKPRLHAIYVPAQERKGPEMLKRIQAMAAEKPAGRFDFGDEAPARARIEAQNKTKQLENIVTTENGVEVARQRFEYFSNGLSHLRINEFREGDGWNAVEEYGYEWDEDGYCTSQWGCTYDGMSGMKNEFTYNDRKLGIEKLVSYYNNYEWVPSEKGEYEYDEYGNITQEELSMYDPDKGMWMSITLNKATWDAFGHQTSFATFSWDGNDWVPTDDRQTCDYDTSGRVTRYGFELWNNGEWTYYYRIRQNFDGEPYRPSDQ